MKHLSFCILLLISLSVFGQGRQENGSITVDGLNRTFVIYIPQGASPAKKMPVLISLHGRLGTGEGMMKFADFRPLADKYKFIIVCPDGIDRSWNDGRATPANKKGVDDVKFIGQLIDYILGTYNCDASRVYATGISNGGFMSSRLACQLSNRIAAIASVAASMNKSAGYLPGNPVPVMYIQGTTDPLVPYTGGGTKAAKGEVYGHDETIKLWIAADHCSEMPITTNMPDDAGDGTSIIKDEYVNSATGVKVINYTINNGGHTWPDGTQYLPKMIIGKVSHNLDACEVIWHFFSQYTLH